MPTPIQYIVALLANILAEIASADASATHAERAYSVGDVFAARQLHDDAERRLMTTLPIIGNLTDAEADAIEPAFTEAEHRLSRVRSLIFPLKAAPDLIN